MTESVGQSKMVLVTGGAGYVGSVLVDHLLGLGFCVTVLDRFFFGSTLADLEGNRSLTLVKGDVRWFDPEILEDVFAVVDLAALSNDPAGELDPAKTFEINCEGRARVARLSKERGVSRYILSSSCSVYGFQDGLLDESSSVAPLTTYAKANYAAEEAVLPLSDDDFTVTVLRLATVYGPSRRMRFDLALNGMTLSLFKTGKITVHGDGSQWRPIVHVRDAGRAFAKVLSADKESVSGERFNVGSGEQNLQIRDLAELVLESVGRPAEIEFAGEHDHRSYRVSSSHIEKSLKFRVVHGPAEAAKTIFKALEDGTLKDSGTAWTVDWYRQILLWQARLEELTLDGAVL